MDPYTRKLVSKARREVALLSLELAPKTQLERLRCDDVLAPAVQTFPHAYIPKNLARPDEPGALHFAALIR